MNEFERLYGQQESVRLLHSIEAGVWTIAVLLAFVIALLLLAAMRRRRAKQRETNWGEIVEKAYDAGRYDEALQTLQTYELLLPRSALVKFWQGRCYFQREAWKEAVEKFEACCRLEPPYRRSVRDYMAFIELNRLVPGLTGYLGSGSGDRGADEQP
jgi:tetratricopeptide (TPR) repeat protein